MITVAWDVDSLDWKEYGADFVVERLTGSQGIRDGSIVLCRADAKDTAEALEDLIREIRGQGYELVGMWELLYREDFYIDQQGNADFLGAGGKNRERNLRRRGGRIWKRN